MSTSDLERLALVPSWTWAETARDTILAGIQDEHRRSQALELAGDIVVQDDELARALLAVVEDDGVPEEQRGQAAIALGPGLEMCDQEYPFDAGLGLPCDAPWTEPVFEEVRATLERVHGDESSPTVVRRCALEAAVRSPQPWQTPATERAFARPEPEWQRTAIFAAGYIGGFDAQILEGLLSGDADVLRESLRAAGMRGHRGASQRALSLAADPNAARHLRLAAIEALGGLRPERAEEVLLELMDGDDEELAAEAEEAMVFIRLDDEFDGFDDF